MDKKLWKALVVFSGGMDSTVALYWAKQQFQHVRTVTFDYGSKHNSREYEYAKLTCARLQVENTWIPLHFMNEHFRSNLLNSGGPVPDGYYTAENMKSTVVPFRNGIMLSIAAGLAESTDCDCIILGNHAGDHTIYPDCRKEFIDAISAAVNLGTDAKVNVLSPFCSMDKAQIAKKGQEMGVDFSLTYSCYKGGKFHCGTCGTCTERIEAFQRAGIHDPTIYSHSETSS